MIYTHAAAAIVAAVVAAAGTWKVQDWRYTAREAERLEAQREITRANALAADNASATHEATKAAARVEFKTIYQEVERVVEVPVYRNVCIDADGLRILGRAIRGDTAAGESAPALPESEPTR